MQQRFYEFRIPVVVEINFNRIQKQVHTICQFGVDSSATTAHTAMNEPSHEHMKKFQFFNGNSIGLDSYANRKQKTTHWLHIEANKERKNVELFIIANETE